MKFINKYHLFSVLFKICRKILLWSYNNLISFFRNLVPSRNRREEWDPSVYETTKTDESVPSVPLAIAIKLKKKEIKKFVKSVNLTDRKCPADDRFHEWLVKLDDGRVFRCGSQIYKFLICRNTFKSNLKCLYVTQMSGKSLLLKMSNQKRSNSNC